MNKDIYVLSRKQRTLDTVSQMTKWCKENNIPITFKGFEVDVITFERIPNAIEFNAVNDYNWFVLRWS